MVIQGEIEKDFQNTLKTWEEIRDKAVNSNAPSLVYEEGDIIKRTLRDTYDNDTKNIYIHGNDAYLKAKKFMKELIIAFGLFLFIEGILYALFPSKMKNMLKKLELINDVQLRTGGLVFAVLGFIIIYYAKS